MESRPLCRLAIATLITLAATAAWSATTTKLLYSFAGDADGEYTDTELVMDSAGNLYGTTPTAGANGMRTIYRMNRESAGAWKFRVIHTFTGGPDGGGGSAGRVLFDNAGNLYGVCTVGGKNGLGTVYRMFRSNGQWQFQTLYAFQGSPDGALPYGGVAIDGSGNLYGTTYYAGAHDFGTVYQLTPANGHWTERVL